MKRVPYSRPRFDETFVMLGKLRVATESFRLIRDFRL